MTGAITPAERRLRWLLIGHAVLSGLLAISYIVQGDTKIAAFIPNSFAKDVLFTIVSVLGAADVRRRGWMALVVAGGYAALVVGQTATLLLGGAPELLGVSGTGFLLGWMAVDLLLIVWFTWWWASAVRAANGLRYLNPIAFYGLVALAEVLIEGRAEAVPPADVARRVDGYLAALHARSKTRVQLALMALCVWPVLPPLPAFSPEARKRFLEKRFVQEIGERRTLTPLRPVVEAIIRTGAQMSYLGYYGDSRGQDAVGYRPFVGRARGRPPGDLPEPSLETLKAPPRRRYDTIVVGSGAAGSVLAYRFAEAGRSVLVLERGPHVDPRDFTDDEVAQYLLLYNEGALQLATNFSLQVLQGMCVGGGTTINNALCLAPPGPVLDGWAERGLERADLETAIGEIREWLDVTRIRDEVTTGAAKRFAAAARELGLPGEVEVMEANITGACVGTGYCNIGCAYGGKKAALDFILPQAQRRFGLDLLADALVEEVLLDGDRATGVAGTHRGERFTVMADEIVVAAGPIASSWLLKRSGAGGDQVGEGLHFNINSPLTADFPDAGRRVRRDPDVARLPAARRPAALPRGDVVQPAGHAVARDAGLVRRALQQPRPLPQHGLRGRAGRHHDARPRDGRQRRPGGRVRGVGAGHALADRGAQGRRPHLDAGRRDARDARDVRLERVPDAGRARRAGPRRDRDRRPVHDQRPPAGRQRPRRRRGRGLPRARRREPVSV